MPKRAKNKKTKKKGCKREELVIFFTWMPGNMYQAFKTYKYKVEASFNVSKKRNEYNNDNVSKSRVNDNEDLMKGKLEMSEG